jgi:hypothetical protein
MGYAPGKYHCRCVDCDEEFQGDKRALRCLECAASAANRALSEARPAAGSTVEQKPDLKAFAIILDNGQGRVCRGDSLSRDDDWVTIWVGAHERAHFFRPLMVSEQ